MVKIVIEKTDPKSAIINDNINVAVESKVADAYIALIRKTWPTTQVKKV